MAITASDIVFRKSVVQTDTDANGGRKGMVLVNSGVRHALFPRVTKAQLSSGIQRWRKYFYCNENADDETSYGVLIYLMRPSNAGDRFYLAEGTHRDTQGVFNRADNPYDRVWTGVGQLASALSGEETSLTLTMSESDYQFPNGGYLYLSDNTMTGQTIDSDVSIGNSVTFADGSWSKIGNTTDISYPNGWCVAADEVLTIQDTTNEEFLQIAENTYSGEVIGTGDGSNATITLSTLTNNTNGISRQPDYLPVITTVCGGTTRTVNIDADGVCSGYCTGGQLNMETGAWTTDITWESAPDNGVNITAAYAERPYSYSGNDVTVQLKDQVANAYSVGGTYGSGCIYSNEVKCSVESWNETSSEGTYDETTYPLTLYNDGTVEEDWTLTFDDSSTFTVTGGYYGDIGSGSIGSDFSPTNPDTGQPYFTLLSAGWGGTWASGDMISFTTHPSALPILLEQYVPGGTAAESYNVLPVGAYTE